jgi:hypothetical protein
LDFRATGSAAARPVGGNRACLNETGAQAAYRTFRARLANLAERGIKVSFDHERISLKKRQAREQNRPHVAWRGAQWNWPMADADLPCRAAP